ncbi:MAG: Glycosyl transferases group 1 [bacterium ADurb.Bin429]|nr:MAG: Glycosyl transferases group 1 [bacterium ADurb.Bin429]
MRNDVEIILVSSGHSALDQRVFDKEAVSLARAFPRVRVVAPHSSDDVRERVRITALRPYRSRLSRFLLRPLQAFWAARGRGPRVLILQDAELLVLAPLVKLFTGWRLIYDAHEDFPELIRSRTWIPSPLRRPMSNLVALLEKGCARACDGVTGATRSLTEHFSHARRMPLYNLPSRAFIDEVAHHARPQRERGYDVVHLGTLAEPGRLEFLVAVLDELIARKPETRGLIIGVRPDQEQVLAAHFPPERVTVLGKIPYVKVAAYLGDCRIGLSLFPMLYPHLRCAVPVKVFEYMAAGCAVVTSHLPELLHLVGDEGAAQMAVLYTPDVGRCVDAIAQLLDEPEMLERRQAALMHWVRASWNWDAQADQYIRFVADIIGTPSTMPETPAQDELAR